jgi:squamous cell carcinoma antigen recognized by T-cells 3
MTMDEVESLDALAAILTELSENPYDISLHVKHIALAQEYGLQDQLQVAREMLVGVYAVGQDVWTPMIEYRKSQENLATIQGVERVLELYMRAEEDYLCECSRVTLRIYCS